MVYCWIFIDERHVEQENFVKKIFKKIMPSLLSEKDNMMDFPRGGGSGLTNLEIKEIKHEVEAELEVMHSFSSIGIS